MGRNSAEICNTYRPCCVIYVFTGWKSHKFSQWKLYCHYIIHVWLQIKANLPCEHIKLEAGDIIIAGKVNRWLQCHCFQRGADIVDFIQGLSEQLPCHYSSARIIITALFTSSYLLTITTLFTSSNPVHNFVYL